MKPCEKDHRLIFFEGKKCPLCSMRTRASRVFGVLAPAIADPEKKPRKPRKIKEPVDLPDKDAENPFYNGKARMETSE